MKNLFKAMLGSVTPGSNIDLGNLEEWQAFDGAMNQLLKDQSVKIFRCYKTSFGRGDKNNPIIVEKTPWVSGDTFILPAAHFTLEKAIKDENSSHIYVWLNIDPWLKGEWYSVATPMKIWFDSYTLHCIANHRKLPEKSAYITYWNLAERGCPVKSSNPFRSLELIKNQFQWLTHPSELEIDGNWKDYLEPNPKAYWETNGLL